MTVNAILWRDVMNDSIYPADKKSKFEEIEVSREEDSVLISFEDPDFKDDSLSSTSDFSVASHAEIYRIFEFKYFMKTIVSGLLFFSSFSSQKDKRETLYSKIDYEIIKELESRLNLKITDKMPKKEKCYGTYWSIRDEIPDEYFFKSFRVKEGLVSCCENIPYTINDVGECLIAVKSSIGSKNKFNPFLPFFEKDYYYDEELKKKYKIYSKKVDYIDFDLSIHECGREIEEMKNKTIKNMNYMNKRLIRIDLSEFAAYKDIKYFKQENEYRFYIFREDEKDDCNDPKDGIEVRIDLSKMIEEIYIDPRVGEKYPEFQKEIVTELAERGYKNKIKECH